MWVAAAGPAEVIAVTSRHSDAPPDSVGLATASGDLPIVLFA